MTNHTITAQDAFDTVVRHLGSMKERSLRAATSPNSCAYRGLDGQMCAVGRLIRDEDYRPEMDFVDHTKRTSDVAHGTSVASLDVRGLLPDYLKPHVSLLNQLQLVHDVGSNWIEGQGLNPYEARKDFDQIASIHGLDRAVVDEVFPLIRTV